MAKGMDLQRLDDGRLRHPLFGDRGHWYSQPVKPGWWSDSLRKAADQKVHREILSALDRVARKVTEG